MMFEPFPKIPRLRRDCTITEKIDGTNAQVMVVPEGELVQPDGTLFPTRQEVAIAGGFALFAGSRSRWLDTSKTGDNFGFAKWVAAHADELAALGPGRHFGEWYGAGIQRGYGLVEKRFALFNTDKWGGTAARPACCDVVPVLYQGLFCDKAVEDALLELRHCGSRAAPHGFGDPEGIVVFMHASHTLHKVTLEKDEAPKGQS